MELLKRLTQITAPSGNEGGILRIIQDELGGIADSVSTDVMGNITVRKNGGGKRLMLAAHADEIGVMATVIGDDGYIRFSNIGGIRPHYAHGSRVRFLNGTLGVVMAEGDADMKALKLSKMYIDIGAADKADAEKCVNIGDVAGFVGDFEQTERVVISKALDNRIGCYVLIQALKQMKSSKNDIYAVFTAQEELGVRGATTAAYAAEPDMAIAVDVTKTGDTPGAAAMSVKLDGGAAIKVRDDRVITHHAVRERMVKTARDNGIPYQMEVLQGGGTDAGAIHTSRAGVPSGVLSIPTRYVHSSSEMAAVADIEAAVRLLAGLMEGEI